MNQHEPNSSLNSEPALSVQSPCLAVLQPVRALAIDLDGTLVDTLPDFDAAIAAMLAGLRLPGVPRAALATMVGKGSEHLVRCALVHAAGEAQALARFDEALACYFEHYAQVNGRHSRVYPGVVAGLADLGEAGWPMVCLTNKPRAYAQVLLQAMGLAPAFRAVWGGDSFARKKPDPLPIIEAARSLGVSPGELLMVGDSLNDSQAARAAGSPVVLVTYGYNHGEPVADVGADATIHVMTELVSLLSQARRP